MKRPNLPLWQINKARVDPFNEQVKGLLRDNAGLFVQFTEADPEADMKRNTDFIVRVEGGDIACRIRDADKYWRRYGDLTFRHSVPSGAKTEADKVIEGFGRWMFYGWADMARTKIIAWILVDLNVVRARRLIERARVRRQIGENGDGTQFVYIQRPWLTEEDAIAASGGEAKVA